MLVSCTNVFPVWTVGYWVDGGYIMCVYAGGNFRGHQGWWGHVHKPRVHLSIPLFPSISLCDPGVQSHPLDVCPVLFLRLGRRGPQQDHGGLLGASLVAEVRAPASTLSAVVPVAALVRAAVAAEAVDGRAALSSRFQAQGTRVRDRHQTLSLHLTPSTSSWTASGAGSAAVAVWRDGLGFDVEVGVCVDCQRSALRNWAHWPGGIQEGRKGLMKTRSAKLWLLIICELYMGAHETKKKKNL